jgi:hypothetical protein
MDDIVSLLQKLNSNISNSIRVCMPGTIESYDYTTQKANIKISMKELYNNGKEVDYPVVSNVPVVFMTSGGASITLPINRGDSCLVMFADRDMSNWLRGGLGQKPDSTRMHNISDAIAMMGLLPFTKKGGATNNEDVLINYSNASIRITKGGDINITTTKNVNIKSVEDINIESKNINVNITDITTLNSKTINVKSNETTTIDTKNINIKASEIVNINAIELANITSKNITADASEIAKIFAKTLQVKSSEDTTITAKNLSVTTSDVTSIDTKNITINASESVTTTCKDAIITASNEIKTTAVKFTHTGDFIVSGNFELGGTGSGSDGGAITFKGGINNTGDIINTGGIIKSGTITLDTHKHSYLEPVVGSSPTAAVPGTTGLPIPSALLMKRKTKK